MSDRSNRIYIPPKRVKDSEFAHHGLARVLIALLFASIGAAAWFSRQ